MLNSLPLRRAAATLVFALSAACSGMMGNEPRGCTAIGCVNQVSATLRTADNSWPDGLYELTVRFDGAESSCSIRLPEQLPESGGAIAKGCAMGVQFDVDQDVTCESGCDAGVCWNRCTPVAGSYYQRVSIQGTPARVEVTLTRDGQPFAAADVTPTYQDSYPNGRECDVTPCRQASFQVSVP